MNRGYEAKGIRERIRPVRPDEAYRLIHRRHRERPLGTIPTPSQFSDPLGHYSVLYAAQSMQGAVWEGLARDRFARRRRRILAFGEVEPIVVVTLDAIEPLPLINLRHGRHPHPASTLFRGPHLTAFEDPNSHWTSRSKIASTASRALTVKGGYWLLSSSVWRTNPRAL